MSIPFFCRFASVRNMYDGEDRTSDLTVQNTMSCRRRDCQENVPGCDRQVLVG